MCQEVLEIVQKMDLTEMSTQMILQCAPVIAGLKASNLLNLSRNQEENLQDLLAGSCLEYRLLYESEYRSTYLIFQRESLNAYVNQEKVQELFCIFGYGKALYGNKNFSLGEILDEFAIRFQHYMKERKSFPHEVGLLLAYPVEDVEGFIKHQGQHFLYAGYWKVYGKLWQKKQLFQKMEREKEAMIQLASHGVDLLDIIEIYSENRMQKLAV